MGSVKKSKAIKVQGEQLSERGNERASYHKGMKNVGALQQANETLPKVVGESCHSDTEIGGATKKTNSQHVHGRSINSLGGERAGAERQRQSDYREEAPRLRFVSRDSDRTSISDILSKSIFSEFVNKYSLSKTLRFRLKPVGKTKRHIKEKGLLSEDGDKASKYKQAKRIIDEYHKWHIDNRLKDFNFKIEDLEEYKKRHDQLRSNSRENKKNSNVLAQKEKHEGELRKKIASCLEDKKLFKKELIKELLLKWLKEKPEVESRLKEEFKKPEWKVDGKSPDKGPQKIIESFEKWTAYFGGFHKNRENIYTHEEKSTAIAFRIVHENLDRFLDNMDRYEKLKKIQSELSQSPHKADVDKVREFQKELSEVEKTFDVKLDDFFSLKTFNKCLTQKGIDWYNQILGGQSKEGNEKQQGVNEEINLYRQQFQSEVKRLQKEGKGDEAKQKKGIAKDLKGCQLVELYKQILSDRDSNSFRFEAIKSDADLCEQITSLFHISDKNGSVYLTQVQNEEKQQGEESETNERVIHLTEKISELSESLEESDLTKVWIKNDSSLTQISQSLFRQWGDIKECLEYYAEQKLFPTPEGKGATKKLKDKRKKWVNKSYHSLSDIHKALEYYYTHYYSDEDYKNKERADNNRGNVVSIEKGRSSHNASEDKESYQLSLKEKKQRALSQPLLDYFKEPMASRTRKDGTSSEPVKILDWIKESYKKAHPIFEEHKDIAEEKLKNKDDEISKIKDYLDSVIALYHFLKPFHFQLKPKDKKQNAEVYETDGGFYSEFEKLYESISLIIPLYNQARNYLTKKPYSVEKYKLNFEHSTLLKGFADSYTEKSDNGTQNGGYIFRKKIEGYNEYDYFLGISRDSKLFRCHNKDKIKEGDQSEYERLEYCQPKGHFLQGKYPNNKKEILAFLKVKVSQFSKEGGIHTLEESKDLKSLISSSSLEKNTPSSIIKKIEKYPEMKWILQDSDLDKILSQTVRDIQDHLKNGYLEKYPCLQDIVSKKYSGYKDFLNMIEFLDKKDKSERVFNFFPVSKRELDEAQSDEKKDYLYLFKISNKDLDFYEKKNKGLRQKKGRDNLHTLYFKHLLADNNPDRVFDLGSGEVFFRKKSDIKNNTIHKKNEPLVCRTYKSVDSRTGEEHSHTLSPEEHKELTKFYKNKDRGLSQHSLKLEENKLLTFKDKAKVNRFNYEIIKDKRYTEDRFLLHLSVNCNFKASNKDININKDVENLLNHPPKDMNIIGIDRGERHLAYYTVINQKGEILDQGSLNNPMGKKDYHDLLDKREKERDGARKSWGTIGKIKDLKEGYMSQVVHKITQLMVQHNAIVVLEDLNSGFKRGRLKVEKQVYQKLEKRLIDKLNYLMFKECDPQELGGALKALQLTAPFESFQKIGKQTGFLFYVYAAYTSKVCPATGFIDLLRPKHESLPKSQEFFEKFDRIAFNNKEGHFEFCFNYKNFTNKADGLQQEWVVCTHGDRLENRKENNKWKSDPVNLTKEMKELFNQHSISYPEGKNIKEEIVQQENADFFEQLMKLLKLTLQMRNSRINSKEDWIISPVKNKNGHFFNNQKDKDGKFVAPIGHNNGPQDADANGAYHIALKGLLMVDQIRHGEGKIDLSNRKWYQSLKKRVNGTHYSKPDRAS